jgi:hypothetical protein
MYQCQMLERCHEHRYFFSYRLDELEEHYDLRSWISAAQERLPIHNVNHTPMAQLLSATPKPFVLHHDFFSFR